MRRLHNLTIVAAAGSLAAMMGLAATSARAENNYRFQPAPRAAAPTPRAGGSFAELRRQVRQANESIDGCR